MNKDQIEKFAVGYPYPTDYVEFLLIKYDFNKEKVHSILIKSQREVINEVQDTTVLTDGFTECCGYDFGLDGFGKVKVKFCPLCGKRIVKINK